MCRHLHRPHRLPQCLTVASRPGWNWQKGSLWPGVISPWSEWEDCQDCVDSALLRLLYVYVCVCVLTFI